MTDSQLPFSSVRGPWLTDPLPKLLESLLECSGLVLTAVSMWVCGLCSAKLLKKYPKLAREMEREARGGHGASSAYIGP